MGAWGACFPGETCGGGVWSGSAHQPFFGVAIASVATNGNAKGGARIAGTTGGLRAFVEGAYVFQGDISTDRAFSLIGARGTFTVRGVTPGDFGRIGSGLEADIGRGSCFVRGDVWTGGGNRQGTVRIGARVRL